MTEYTVEGAAQTVADIETITLDKNKLYLVLEATTDEDNEAGLKFAIYDRLEFSEDNVMIACLLRGMVSMALNRTEEVIQLGAECFKAEAEDVEVVTEDGFPICKGTA